jgi:putative transposase
MKYQPDYPGRFASVLHARAWLQTFFGWHNDDHHHSGLALFTPAEVFYHRVPAVHSVRQDALDAAYALHPGRFPNGPPKAALPPAEVHINPLEALVISVGHAETFASVNVDAPRFDDTPGSGPQKAAAAVAFSS